MDLPSGATVRVKGKPTTVRDAIIRARAVNAVLDDSLSRSGSVRDDPATLSVRVDLNVPKTLAMFERELTTLANKAFVAEMEWANAATHAEAWKGRRLQAEKDGEPLLAQQAATRHHEDALVATELRLELEEWQQMVTDYSAIIAMLRERLGSVDSTR